MNTFPNPRNNEERACTSMRVFFWLCICVSFAIFYIRQRSGQLLIARKLDLTDTIKDGARLFLLDEGIRRQLLLALTEDSKLHVQEVCKVYYKSAYLYRSYKPNSIMPFQLVDVYRLLEDQIDVPSVALQVAQGKASLCMEVQRFPNFTFSYIFLTWNRGCCRSSFCCSGCYALVERLRVIG